MSALWKTELDELNELRRQRGQPVSHDAKAIARDLERRSELPKLAAGDNRAFLRNLDKIARGDATVERE